MTPDALQSMARDPAAFRRALLIDTDAGPRPLAEVADPWQAEDFAALDPGWQRAMGQDVPGGFSRAYLERPRGHSKTADLAAMIAQALFGSRRRLAGVAAAADQDQSRLLRDAISRLVALNDWLGACLDVQAYRVVNPHTESTLTILSADAASSFGITPDFVVADELCHWSKAGEELWSSLLSAAAKRGHCVLVCISNAGLGQGTSWNWTVREACRTADNWYFHRLDGPTATWITQDRLDEQARMLPAKAFRRLWLNIWTSDTGDALDMGDVDACCTAAGPFPSRVQEMAQEYVAALDLGLKNDHSALVTVGIDAVGLQLRLAGCESWSPASMGGQVRLEEVKQACLDTHRRFGLQAIIYDPWQAALMAEQLAAAGIRMLPWTFNAANQDLMATTLLRVFTNRTIALYRDAALIRDLARLTIVERPQGFRLQSARTSDGGHADRAIALAMALPMAEQWCRELLYEMNAPAEPMRIYA